jgi:4-hydroxyphenylpyruvate dioxygenase
MTPCIATVTLSGGLSRKVEASAKAGFRQIELVEQDYLESGLGVAAVRQCLSDLGVQLAAYQPCRDVEGMPEPLRTAAFTRARQQMDLAAEFGAPLLLLCSATSPLAGADPDQAAEDLFQLADLAAARGLKIAYEALSWGTHVASHAAAWDLVRRADHPALGLALDSFHTLAADLPTDDIALIPGDRIFLVQIADAPRLPIEILQLSRHHRRLPGLGTLDLPRFVDALAKTGYAGVLSVEIFSDELRLADPFATAQAAMQSLVSLRDRTGLLLA